MWENLLEAALLNTSLAFSKFNNETALHSTEYNLLHVISFLDDSEQECRHIYI